MNSEEYITIERNILAKVQHPFVVKMSYAFQNKKEVFFALEYCPGDLYTLIEKS